MASAFPITKVAVHRGWEIYHAHAGNYYLIGEVGDDDYMQRPFKTEQAARRYIDEMVGPEPEPQYDAPATTFGQRFSNVLFYGLWCKTPWCVLWYIFWALVVLGTVTHVEEGSTLLKDMTKTVMSLVLWSLIISTVVAACTGGKAKQQQ